MKFLLKIAYLTAGYAAPICALGAYTNWSVLHSGPIGHAGWSILMLMCCSCSVAMFLLSRDVVESWVVIPGIFPIALTFAGVGVYFVPVTFILIVGTLVGGASLETISFEFVCGLLTLFVIMSGFTGGFGFLE